MSFKKIFLCCLSASLLFSILCFNVFAYSYEDALKDYEKAFDDESNLDDLKEPETKRGGGLSNIPTFEEWWAQKQASEERRQEKAAAAVSRSLELIPSIGEIPFASNSRGASCDSRVAFYDFYRQMYVVIEYNSFYGDVLITPDYSSVDSYFFWIWFRCYYPSSGNHNLYLRVASTYYGPTAAPPDLGFSPEGYPLYAFYVYQFKDPNDYNSAAEVSLGNAFGTSYNGSITATSQKVGRYFTQSRFRIMPVYVSTENYNLDVVVSGHNSVPCVSGLFLYTDLPLTVTPLNSATPAAQTVAHDGTITGNVSVNGYNIYSSYSSFIVNDYNYWLFSNFVEYYKNGVVQDYGIFTDMYNAVVPRLQYVSEVIIPQAKDDMVTFITDKASIVNGVLNVFITGNATVFWFFNVLIGVLVICLVLRVVIYITRWN